MTTKLRSSLSSQIGTPAEDDDIGPSDERGGIAHNRPEFASSTATQQEVAGYIEGMTGALRAMAQSAELDSLAYFLEMARLEASIQKERLGRLSEDPDHVEDEH